MIPKTKKKKMKIMQPSNNIPSQLSNLPPQFIKTVQNITSFGCVTKSWRSSSRQCSPARLPQLVEISLKRKHIIQVGFYGGKPPIFYYSKNIAFSPDTLSSGGHSHGYISVIEPMFSENGHPIPIEYYKSRTVLKMEFDWVLKDCNVKDPYAFKERMLFTNVITFQRKFYALSLQGSLVVIEYIDSRFRVSSIGASRAVPSGVSRQFKEYLLKWNDEILLVFLISRKSIGGVDDVEVFRLDMLKLLWVKVESLGESILFIGDQCCKGLNARNVGCKSNCIYFTHLERVSKWFVYVMGSKGQIFPAFGTGCARWDETEELD